MMHRLSHSSVSLFPFQNYTQYIPLSIYDLQTWMGSPSIFVYDCSNAGIIVKSFKQFALQREQELEVGSGMDIHTNGLWHVTAQQPCSVKIIHIRTHTHSLTLIYTVFIKET